MNYLFDKYKIHKETKEYEFKEEFIDIPIEYIKFYKSKQWK